MFLFSLPGTKHLHCNRCYKRADSIPDKIYWQLPKKRLIRIGVREGSRLALIYPCVDLAVLQDLSYSLRYTFLPKPQNFPMLQHLQSLIILIWNSAKQVPLAQNIVNNASVILLRLHHSCKLKRCRLSHTLFSENVFLTNNKEMMWPSTW